MWGVGHRRSVAAGESFLGLCVVAYNGCLPSLLGETLADYEILAEGHVSQHSVVSRHLWTLGRVPHPAHVAWASSGSFCVLVLCWSALVLRGGHIFSALGLMLFFF